MTEVEMITFFNMVIRSTVQRTYKKQTCVEISRLSHKQVAGWERNRWKCEQQCGQPITELWIKQKSDFT